MVLASLGTLSYLLITHYIIQAVQVEGSSMYPTLTDSGHYWLNRFSYVISEPRQNDIVALKDPRDNMLEVKRIIPPRNPISPGRRSPHSPADRRRRKRGRPHRRRLL